MNTFTEGMVNNPHDANHDTSNDDTNNDELSLSSSSTNAVPFPIAVSRMELCLNDKASHKFISFTSTELLLRECETKCSKSVLTMSTTHTQQAQSKKVVVSFDQAFVALTSSLTLTPVKIQGITMTTSLDKDAIVKVPMIQYNGERCLISAVQANISSVVTATELHTLMNTFTDYFTVSKASSETIPHKSIISVKVSRTDLSMSFDGNEVYTFVLNDLLLNIYEITCDKICIQSTRGNDLQLQTIHVDMVDDVTIQIESIPLILAPGKFKLLHPLTSLSVEYKLNELSISSNSSLCIQLESEDEAAHLNKSTGDSGNIESNVSIPVTTKIVLKEVILFKACQNQVSEKAFSISNLTATLLPTAIQDDNDVLDFFDVDEPKNGTTLSLEIGNIQSNVMAIKNLHVSLSVCSDDLYSLKQLSINLEQASVNAGYSSVDWSSIMTKTKNSNSKTIKTPFARVGQIDLDLCVKGIVLKSSAKINIPTFSGDRTTTKDNLIDYFSKYVTSRVPDFLCNVEFLGGKTADSTFSTVGMTAASRFDSGLIGGGIGSVVGAATLDGVKGRIAAGKKARGVEKNDAYRFGDITRGKYLL